MHQHAFLYHFPISRTAEHQTNHLKAEWDPKLHLSAHGSPSLPLKVTDSGTNMLTGNTATLFWGVKQTTHSRESYVSTCNEVCPRKILPPHFFTAHFTKAPPPPRKQECQHYFFHLPYRLYEFKRTLKWAKLAEIKLSDCLQRKRSWPQLLLLGQIFTGNPDDTCYYHYAVNEEKTKNTIK